MKRESNETREWINTGIALIAVIIMLFGYFQIKDINIELKNINADSLNSTIIISENITTKDINGIECVVFSSGGKWCSSSVKDNKSNS